MKNRISTVILLLLLLFSKSLLAQDSFLVEGQVFSADDGYEMIGAIVRVKGSTIGTTTNHDGKFSIKVNSEKDVLLFSMIGYKDVERVAQRGTQMKVEMTEDTQELGEVVVVGYGVQKKASMVGSITQSKGEELLKAGGVTNISSALSGILPGVTAISSSGEPGKDQAKIFIRGRSTWGNSEPLVLVDGIERSMNDVDPNEIESVSVLKDASATAVYGVKGANGVILITTKRGDEGRPQISFSTNIGFKQPTYSHKSLDQVSARYLYNEALRNEGDWDKLYSEQNINHWRTMDDPYYHPEIDWNKEVVKDFGLSQQYNINVSGGTKKIKYFTSLGYMKDGDIFKTEKQPEYDPSFKYERYNYRGNIDLEVTKTTKLSVNLAGDIGIRNRPMGHMGGDPLASSDSGLFQLLYLTPNYVFPVRYENGILGTTPIGRWWNPLYVLNYQGAAKQKSARSMNDVILKQDFSFLLEGLSAQAKVSYNTLTVNDQTIKKDILAIYQSSPDAPEQWFSDADPVTEWVDKPAKIADKSLSRNVRDLYYEVALNYANQWGDHEVSALAVFNRRQLNTKADFPNYEEAWVGRATYAFAHRYLAEFNAAYTGSEKFAPKERFGFFPSFAAGWVISEEPIYKQQSWLNWMPKLKLRYSYGEVGSDRGASSFTYISDYSTGKYSVFGDRTGYTYGPLYFENKAANVYATWETSKKQNFGIEVGILSKLNVTVDLFSEKRTGILMNRSNTTPAWFGQAPADANIGETKSHGYEIEAEWKDIISKDFSYFVRGGFSFQENRVIHRDDPVNRPDYLRNAGKPIGYDSRLLQNGFLNSWDDVYNYTPSTWENASRQPGDMRYIDYNGDAVIDTYDKVPMDLNGIPAYTYTFNLGFSYRRFDVRANFYGVFDVEKRLTYNLLWEFPTKYVMAWPESNNRWTPETAETATRPRIGLSMTKHNRENSTYGVSSASYLRLKTLEVSYNLAPNIINKIGLSSCQLYVNGNNLFTISSFDKRVDPESADEGVYPLMKRYNVGFRVKF